MTAQLSAKPQLVGGATALSAAVWWDQVGDRVKFATCRSI